MACVCPCPAQLTEALIEAADSVLHDGVSLQGPEVSLLVSGLLPNGPVVCVSDSSPF